MTKHSKMYKKRRSSSKRRHHRRMHGGTDLAATVKHYQDVLNDNIKIDTKNVGYCDADCTPHVYYDQDPDFKQLGGRRKSKKHLKGGQQFPTKEEIIAANNAVQGKFLPIQMHPGYLNLATVDNLVKYETFLKKLNKNPLMRAQLGGKSKRKSKKSGGKKTRRLH